ncbi:Opticin [Frankliniella fusca]|uniref:Opticin n=1 Tax=Frankliniella fusca TaxID=407009 RepID=A0AAE1HYF3_9NEOP|nr:Opticin [Frankliniella fusca]
MAAKMKCSRLDIVWDQYEENSLKAATRESRGAGARRRGLPQKGALPKQSKLWDDYLKNDANKQEMFIFLAEKALEINNLLIVTNVKDAMKTSNVQCQGSSLEGFSCARMEEADGRLFLHCRDMALLNRIRKRAKEEIENNGINIDTDSSHDLARIFQQEYNNMTPVQRIFWSEQMKALSCQKKPSSIRWNPFLIKMAIHLRMKTTSQGYKYIQNFIKLPSERTLYDYTHAVQSKEGIQDAAVADLVHKSSSYKEEHLKYFNLEFDEMHIRQDIVINKKTGEIIGYANLRQVEKDLADIEAEISKTDSAHPVAKTVLVYLAQGVTNPLLSAVGIYPSRDLSAGQLFSRTWDIVYTLESCGLKVLCLICDGASMNKKFFIIRKAGKCGRMEKICPVTIEKLYAASPHKFASHNLTRAHIKLTPFSCMKVILATQTMSNSVSRDLQEKRDHPTLTNCDTTELIKFIKIVNDGFDCLNGSGDIQGKRNKYNNLLLPYTDVNDERFKWLQEEYLGFFQDWKKSIEQRKGKFSADAREKMCVSHQAYESMHITSYGFIGLIN